VNTFSMKNTKWSPGRNEAVWRLWAHENIIPATAGATALEMDISVTAMPLAAALTSCVTASFIKMLNTVMVVTEKVFFRKDAKFTTNIRTNPDSEGKNG